MTRALSILCLLWTLSAQAQHPLYVRGELNTEPCGKVVRNTTTYGQLVGLADGDTLCMVKAGKKMQPVWAEYRCATPDTSYRVGYYITVNVDCK